MAKKRRKKPEPSIPELSADSGRFILDFQNETDRGVALAAAAFMEDVLAAFLRAAFIDKKSVSKNLLDYPGALSSFAAKTDMAYALGLIGPKAYADMGIIRKIRNTFAHAHHTVSFEDSEVQELCNKLDLVLLESFHGIPRPRDRFVARSVFLINEVLLHGLSQEHVAVGKDITGGQRLVSRPKDIQTGATDDDKRTSKGGNG